MTKLTNRARARSEKVKVLVGTRNALESGMKHQCNRLANGHGWLQCTTCEGRIHLVSCTTKLNPKFDCCARRHLKLASEGYEVGIVDNSARMDNVEGLEN